MMKVSTQVFGKQPQAQHSDLSSEKTSRNLILWIDGVGGFLLLDRDELLIGQAVAGGHQDIGIIGDLSRQAAVIQRVQSDYLIRPLQETRLDGHIISGPHLLTNGSTLGFGRRVQLVFRMPHPLSSSARLDLISQHRFQPRVEGVVLLADSCVLGPSESCHVQCPHWSQDLLMFRTSNQWLFRATEEVEVNGSPKTGQIALASGLRIRGSEFSFSVE